MFKIALFIDNIIHDPKNLNDNFFVKNNKREMNKTPFKILGKSLENKNKYIIEFQDENKFKIEATEFSLVRNAIKNPFQPSVFGVGYLGSEINKYPTSINGKKSICYQKWHNMLQRCYDEKSLEKYPTYRGCKVCKSWLNYSNFARWWYKWNFNEFSLNDEFMCLDKDIINKNNKTYSPKNCLYIPNRINTLFVLEKSNKSSNLPVGIYNYDSYYRAHINFNGKIYEKSSKDLNELIEWYKINKIECIKINAK